MKALMWCFKRTLNPHFNFLTDGLTRYLHDFLAHGRSVCKTVYLTCLFSVELKKKWIWLIVCPALLLHLTTGAALSFKYVFYYLFSLFPLVGVTWTWRRFWYFATSSGLCCQWSSSQGRLGYRCLDWATCLLASFFCCLERSYWAKNPELASTCGTVSSSIMWQSSYLKTSYLWV